LPSTVTAGAAVEPLIRTSASPPVTSWGIDDKTWMLMAAEAAGAPSAAHTTADDAMRRQAVAFIA
jgi:hypothetical protein